MTTTPDLADLCNRIGLALEWAPSDRNPHMRDMPPGSQHYKCTLELDGERMELRFSKGPACEYGVTVEEVVACLCMDALGYFNVDSFEEWAEEYGYDTDSRQAEKTYKAVANYAHEFKALCGEHFDALCDAASEY